MITDALSDIIKEFWGSCIPTATMNPDNDFVSDDLSRHIVQEILLPVIAIGNLCRLIFFLYPDCNGHSTLFDGVVYLPELYGSRDTCVFEAGEGEGVYMAELDVDMLRNYRRCEVWGLKNRRPELYGVISEYREFI